MNEWTPKWLHPDSIRDSIRIGIVAADSIRDLIRTKISDSQVRKYTIIYIVYFLLYIIVWCCRWIQQKLSSTFGKDIRPTTTTVEAACSW